jgi:hypothetical protein
MKKTEAGGLITQARLVTTEEGTFVSTKGTEEELNKAKAAIAFVVTDNDEVVSTIEGSQEQVLQLWAYMLRSMRKLDKQLLLTVVRDLVRQGGHGNVVVDILTGIIAFSGILIKPPGNVQGVSDTLSDDMKDILSTIDDEAFGNA